MKHLLKKKSVLVLAILFFWVAYVGIVSTQYYENISQNVTKVIESRKKQVDFVLEFSASLLIKDNTEYLTERLRQARDFRLLDFYILQKSGKVVSFYNQQNNADDLNMDFAATNYNRFVETDEIAFKTIKIYDYVLTVGIVTGKLRYFKAGLRDHSSFIAKDFALVTFFLGLILYMLLKDIVNLSKIVSSKNRKEMTNIKSISREGEAILKAASSYENEQKHLKDQKDFLAGSLTPAILHEINSGTPAPHIFESTMVRVDLNGYTQLYLEKKDEYVTGILNTYFTAARELIERYGGLIYQYVGDEIVFHFKGPRKMTEAVATACVRSLFELADEIEKTLPSEAGHYFKIKASFASGMVRFVKLDTGFGLSGLPLIESARLLGQVDDKSKNTLAVYDSSRDFINKLCSPMAAKESHLKGFDGTTLVCTITEFTDQQTILDANKAEYCTYFRSDVNLIHLMGYMEKLVKEQNEELFFRVYGDMKNLKTHIICNELEEAFTHFLEATYRQSHDKAVNPKVLASAVTLTQLLVPTNMVSNKLTEILKLYLQFTDPRVRANAVSVLGDAPSNVRFLRKFIHSDDNRVSADALVVAGKQVVDQELVKRVHSLLKSPDKVYQASGRYVALKLVEYYKEHDAVYYNTNPHLKKLEDLLGKVA
ncbi:MAG: adenylate cyclase [Bdellovibrionales bacterium]|nr:adenylate cyclase [Oligoflexia bacterium]